MMNCGSHLKLQEFRRLKIHVIPEHLSDCLKMLDGNALGCWSEQAGESVHSKFLDYWNKFKITKLDAKNYEKHLKNAVVEISSLNL